MIPSQQPYPCQNFIFLTLCLKKPQTNKQAVHKTFDTQLLLFTLLFSMEWLLPWGHIVDHVVPEEMWFYFIIIFFLWT